jgi:cytochrome c oxidase subunit 4
MNQPMNLSKIYTRTYIALIALLIATFAIAHIDLGPFSTTVGVLIASAKAVLVVLYFMHFRYSNGIHRVAAVVGLFWFGILLSLTLTDYLSRNWLPLPGQWPGQ